MTLGIYQKKMKTLIQKDTRTPMFMAPWLTIANIQKQRKCPSTEKWIDTYMKVSMLLAQSCPTLCNPMYYSRPGSSVHGILQARILKWVAIPFSRGSSQSRDWAWVSCPAGRFFTICATREAHIHIYKLEYYSTIKKKEFFNNVNGLGGYYAKWKNQRKKITIWYHFYVKSKKKNKTS